MTIKTLGIDLAKNVFSGDGVPAVQSAGRGLRLRHRDHPLARPQAHHQPLCYRYRSTVHGLGAIERAPIPCLVALFAGEPRAIRLKALYVAGSSAVASTADMSSS